MGDFSNSEFLFSVVQGIRHAAAQGTNTNSKEQLELKLTSSSSPSPSSSSSSSSSPSPSPSSSIKEPVEKELISSAEREREREREKGPSLLTVETEPSRGHSPRPSRVVPKFFNWATPSFLSLLSSFFSFFSFVFFLFFFFLLFFFPLSFSLLSKKTKWKNNHNPTEKMMKREIHPFTKTKLIILIIWKELNLLQNFLRLKFNFFSLFGLLFKIIYFLLFIPSEKKNNIIIMIKYFRLTNPTFFTDTKMRSF